MLKKMATTILAARLHELAIELSTGRVDRADYDAMREPILAELIRRAMKGESK